MVSDLKSSKVENTSGPECSCILLGQRPTEKKGVYDGVDGRWQQGHVLHIGLDDLNRHTFSFYGFAQRGECVSRPLHHDDAASTSTEDKPVMAGTTGNIQNLGGPFSTH